MFSFKIFQTGISNCIAAEISRVGLALENFGHDPRAKVYSLMRASTPSLNMPLHRDIRDLIKEVAEHV